MIISRNSDHGANLRVCMGIFTIGFRSVKIPKISQKKIDIPFIYGVLFVVSLFPFADLRSF